ncbi:MAG: hypothetical protein ABW252_21360 [Polyangiales bacterium]
MSTRGFRPLLTSWLTRWPRPEALASVRRADDCIADRSAERQLGDWLYVEDATSRWLRTTQGAELG